jgi:hypothetical protein
MRHRCWAVPDLNGQGPKKYQPQIDPNKSKQTYLMYKIEQTARDALSLKMEKMAVLSR